MISFHLPSPPGIIKRRLPYPIYCLNAEKNGIQRGGPFNEVNNDSITAEASLALPLDSTLPEDYLYLEEASAPHEQETECLDGLPAPTVPSSSTAIAPVQRTFPLSKTDLENILRTLPDQYRFFHWKVVFDTVESGCSLLHFYRAMNAVGDEEAPGIGIFIVRPLVEGPPTSSSGHETARSSGGGGREGQKAAGHPNSSTAQVIGCFTPVVPCEHLLGLHHAGASQTYVFRLEDAPTSASNMSVYRRAALKVLEQHSSLLHSVLPTRSEMGPAAASPPPSPQIIRVYRWQAASLNNRFLRVDGNGLSIGGGSQGAAIWVNPTLDRGTSSRFCETFCCPSLVQATNAHSSQGAASTLLHTEFELDRMIWLAADKRRVLHEDAAGVSGILKTTSAPFVWSKIVGEERER